MTQVSVTPPPGAAPAPSDTAPPVLAQAGQRAEFSARLLAALAGLRGGVPPAPLAAGAPADPAELAVAPLEEAIPEEATEETPEETEDDGSLAVPASADASVELAPLVLLQLSSDEPPEDPGGEGAPAAESAADPLAEREAEPAAPRPASFAPAQGLLEQSAAAQLQSAAQTGPATEDEAAPAVDAATGSTAPSRRAERAPLEAPRPATEPAPDAALARSSELATVPTRTEQSESAAATPGRVLPELPVRNEQEIVDQVRFLLNRRGGQASIELHPPQLGQLGLRISVTDHAVRLEITADRLQVAELLHKHLPELQHALEAQGLQIDRAQVDLRERGGDGRERGGDPGDADARRGTRDPDDGSQRQPSYARSTLPAYSLGAVDVHA